MHILILGYSQIVRRRVIPALGGLKDFSRVDIAFWGPDAPAERPVTPNGRLFEDFAPALAQSEAELVYVSTVNSAHAEWVRKALESGRHVCVDKPAFLSLKDAEAAADLASRKGLCLAEATVYASHPQIAAVQGLFAPPNAGPLRLTVLFSVPPFPPENFRYEKKLGGGALYDMGPYAASVSRLILADRPDEVLCRINSRRGGDGVETSFSVLASYSGGRSFAGHFGFDTEYKNYLNVLGPDRSVEMNRVFTTPADLPNEIKVREKNEGRVVKIPAADSFALFLDRLREEIKAKTQGRWIELMLKDADLLDSLRRAALRE